MNLRRGENRIIQALKLMTLALLGALTFFAMINFFTSTKAATSLDQTLSTSVIPLNDDKPSPKSNQIGSNLAQDNNDVGEANLAGSQIAFKTFETGPFYPEDLIKLQVETKVQGTGTDFSDGHAKIFVSKKNFKQVNSTDVSNGDELKNAPTITSDSDNYIINLDFKTLVGGEPSEIPFILQLKPGGVNQDDEYTIPIQYTDKNGKVIYTNNTFKVKANTESPGIMGPTRYFTLDYRYWDGDKLNQDYRGVFSDNGLTYNSRTQPGDYTVSVKIPDGYEATGGYGDRVYDKSTNTITSHFTITPEDLENLDRTQDVDLFGFSLIFPKGTPAKTKVTLPHYLTGPKSGQWNPIGQILKDDRPTPYFDATNKKSAWWSGGAQYLDYRKVTAQTPVISTLSPVQMNNVDGLNADGKLGNNYADLESITDTPDYDFPMNKLEMVDTDKLSTSFKDKLNDNTVTATSNGKAVSLGALRFGQPIDLKGNVYSNITIKFNTPVRFNDPSQTNFQIQTTGHITQKAIDDFANDSDPHKLRVSWSNQLTTKFSKTSEDQTAKSSVYHNPEITTADFGLTKPDPTPPAPAKPIIFMQDYQGMGIIGNNAHEVLGEQPFTSNFVFGVVANSGAKRHPKNGKLVLIVPDGVTLGSPYADGLANLRVEPNFQGSGQTAIIGDVANLTDYENPSSRGISYQVSLQGEPELLAGGYDIDGYLVFDNNNWDVFPKTDFFVQQRIDTSKDYYDLYRATDDPNCRFSASTFFNYSPNSSSLNINKVSVGGSYVSNTGNSLHVGDNFNYQSSVINNGKTPYNHLDLVDILPYVGDKKISEAGGSTSRGSTMDVHLRGPITGLPKGYKAVYSTDDPSKLNGLADSYKATFTDTPDDWSKVTMIRVTANDGTVLSPKQKVTFTYPATFSKDAKVGSVAVNTFLMRKSDGDPLLESTPATARIADSTSDVTIQFWGRKSDSDDYKSIATPIVKTNQPIGEAFPAKASDFPAIANYVPVDNDDHGLSSVSSDPTQNVIKLYYKYQETPVTPATVDGTAKFKDEDGNKIADDVPFGFKEDEGKPYKLDDNQAVQKTKDKLADDYIFIDTDKPTSGTFEKDKPVVITYNFVKKGAVTVRYVDSNGVRIHDPQILKGKPGAQYDVSGEKYQPEISGYTLDKNKMPKNATGLFTKNGVVVTYVYKKHETPINPVDPVNPVTPVTPINPTPSPQPTPAPEPNPTNNKQPSVVAKKGEAVYSLKKIYLYKNNTFSKHERLAGYVKKPRVYRPMFVVTGYAHSKNGHLRYKVRDVNHLTKNRHKKGYITANWNYVRPVYYQSKHQTLTVINPRGVNAYKKANLTGKVRNYKQGTQLKVTKFVHHNLTIRYVLSNGQYITGNRKLIQMGKQKMPRYVKVKKNINRYKDVNFTKRNKHIKKGTKLRIKNYDFSHANSVTKTGAMRYHVAGGYVTANAKFVKTTK